MGCDVVVTTDHGTIRVEEPNKAVSDRRNHHQPALTNKAVTCACESRDVFEIGDPAEVFLPKINIQHAV